MALWPQQGSQPVHIGHILYRLLPCWTDVLWLRFRFGVRRSGRLEGGAGDHMLGGIGRSGRWSVYREDLDQGPGEQQSWQTLQMQWVCGITHAHRLTVHGANGGMERFTELEFHMWGNQQPCQACWDLFTLEHGRSRVTSENKTPNRKAIKAALHCTTQSLLRMKPKHWVTEEWNWAHLTVFV